MKTIILIGMPAAGKSSIGKALAKKMNKTFIDIDKLIFYEVGMSISEYFQKYGEASFRKIESKIFNKAIQQEDIIISTGGGIVKNKSNFNKITKDKFIVVHIKRALNDIKINSKRPLLKSEADLKKIFFERKNLYKKYADISIYNYNFYKTINKLEKKIILYERYHEKEK